MGYCTIQDIRDEGITEDDLSDARATILIDGWSTWIDKRTGQFFEIRTGSMDFDGNGSRTLFLPVPIVECTALYINDDFTNAVETSRYTVYDRRGPLQDDRRNPKISLKQSLDYDIFANVFPSIFLNGDLNQRVTGDWGYVEADDSTPVAIQRATVILVIATSELIGDDGIDQLKIGRIIEEVTDRHRIEYSDLYDKIGVWMPTGITEVDMALSMYKAPYKLAAPRTMFSPLTI